MITVARGGRNLYLAHKATTTNGVHEIVQATGMESRYRNPDLTKYHNQAVQYTESPLVYIAVSKISRTSAVNSTFNYYQYNNGKKKQIYNSDAEQLLRRPNPKMSQFSLIEQTTGFLQLNGNAFWYLASKNGGQPDQIYIMRPDRMRIKPGLSEDRPVDAYVYATSAVEIPLDPEQVIHFKRWNPLNDYYGLSPIEAAATELLTDEKMGEFNRNLFGRNNAIPRGAVAIKGMVSDPEFERIKYEWRNTYGGTQQATAFIRGADVSWVNIGMNHQDMDFLNARGFNKEMIMLVYGIPPGMLDKNATEANARAGLETFIRDTIYPQQVEIASVLTLAYAPFFDDKLVIEAEDIRLKDATAEREQFYADGSIMTINELREKYNQLLPVEWGDIPPAGAGAAAITGQPIGKPGTVPKDVRQSGADVPVRQAEQRGESGKALPEPDELLQLGDGQDDDLLATKECASDAQRRAFFGLLGHGGLSDQGGSDNPAMTPRRTGHGVISEGEAMGGEHEKFVASEKTKKKTAYDIVHDAINGTSRHPISDVIDSHKIATASGKDQATMLGNLDTSIAQHQQETGLHVSTGDVYLSHRDEVSHMGGLAGTILNQHYRNANKYGGNTRPLSEKQLNVIKAQMDQHALGIRAVLAYRSRQASKANDELLAEKGFDSHAQRRWYYANQAEQALPEHERNERTVNRSIDVVATRQHKEAMEAAASQLAQQYQDYMNQEGGRQFHLSNQRDLSEQDQADLTQLNAKQSELQQAVHDSKQAVSVAAQTHAATVMRVRAELTRAGKDELQQFARFAGKRLFGENVNTQAVDEFVFKHVSPEGQTLVRDYAHEAADATVLDGLINELIGIKADKPTIKGHKLPTKEALKVEPLTREWIEGLAKQYHKAGKS